MVNPQVKKLLIFISGLLAICLFLVGFVWWQEQQSQFLEVVFFDVGQGDSIFIKTPSNHSILIDGGPDSTVLSKLGRNLPFYDHTIDLMILTHAHSDHVAGLVDVLKRYDVTKVLYTGVDHSSPDFIEWEKLIEQKGIEMIMPVARQVYQFEEVELEILYPFEDVSTKEFKDLNDSSVIARLEYQDVSFLFTGDAPVEVEEELLGYYGRDRSGLGPEGSALKGDLSFSEREWSSLQSDVLKVGHHGSKYSSSLEFLQTVDSDYAVIQSKEGNKFGHPHRLILQRLIGLDVEILRNDELGDVELVSDGVEIWLE